jgi:hypothetical protein
LIDAIRRRARSPTASPAPAARRAGRVIGINAQIRSDDGGPAGYRLRRPDRRGAPARLPDLAAAGPSATPMPASRPGTVTPSIARTSAEGDARRARRPDHAGRPAALRASAAATSQERVQGSRSHAAATAVTAIDGDQSDGADLVRIVTNTLAAGTDGVLRRARDERARSWSSSAGSRPIHRQSVSRRLARRAPG